MHLALQLPNFACAKELFSNIWVGVIPVDTANIDMVAFRKLDRNTAGQAVSRKSLARALGIMEGGLASTVGDYDGRARSR